MEMEIAFCWRSDPCVGCGIEFEVVDRFFCCPPRSLKSTETFVVFGCSTKIQRFDARLGQKFNRFPDRKIISSKLLHPLIRCPEFVNRIRFAPEKNGCGNGLSSVVDADNEAEASFDNISLDVDKERPRLRRRSMTTARSGVQMVKAIHRPRT